MRAIKKSDDKYLLFSGGGIVGPKLLNLPDKKLLHIHPGIVPEIKGADCLFWSILVRGCPGYSCFFMSKEIDQGNILFQKEYSIKDIDFPDYKEAAIDAFYRSILDTLDLHLRSKCLIDFVILNDGNLDVANICQDPHDGCKRLILEFF